MRGCRTQSSELITELRVTTEGHEVPYTAPVIAPVGVQGNDVLMRSMSDLAVTDKCSGGTDHPDPILSQPIVEEPSVPMCTPPAVSRSGMTARERVDQLSPSDRISVRQRLEVDKDDPEVDEEVFSPGFGLDGTVDLGTGGPGHCGSRDWWSG